MAEMGACCACNLKQQKPGTATGSPAMTGKCSAAHEIKYGKRPSCPVLSCPPASLRFASGVVLTEGSAALPNTQASLLVNGTARVCGAQSSSRSPGHASLLKGWEGHSHVGAGCGAKEIAVRSCMMMACIWYHVQGPQERENAFSVLKQKRTENIHRVFPQKHQL